MRERRALSLVLFDLDDFKAINDRHGHPAGDAALRAFAGILRGESRASDVVCRIGGEEFAAILPEVDGIDAERYAVRVLAVTGDAELPVPDRLTASAGLAAVPVDARTEAELLRVADGRLFAAKASGKNRIETGGLAPA